MCNRSQLESVYGEIFRVLKPGSYFVSYEWVSTHKFDAKNAEHVKIIDEINFGNGLPVGSPGWGPLVGVAGSRWVMGSDH
jgi:hypothetical protein